MSALPVSPGQSAPLELAGEFPAATADEWRALVAGVLRKSGLAEDADPIKALSSHTYDGITVAPLYTAADAPGVEIGVPGAAPFVRGATVDADSATGWDVRTRYVDPTAARVNSTALTDLETGATSLWLTLGAGGLPVTELAAALEGVYIDLAPVALDAGSQTREAATALLALAASRSLEPAELTGSLGADPIGLRARTGADYDATLLADLAAQAGEYANLQLATVDGSVYHDAGAADADEIGIATAVGVTYLRALTAAGLSTEAALAALEFRFAVTADQFLTIAKLRAARRVWARVAELVEAANSVSAEISESTGGRGQRQHAVTSAAMMTQRDPWVNMLRTTIACFGAAVGGADAITVTPFDAAIGLSDDFARRIARNTQAILHDESSLGRVLDAAGGSWYVESLTDELAAKAWDTFTAIETAGGALAALDSGLITERLAATRAARDADIAHRRAPITGVTEFAFPAEAPVVRPPAPAAPSGGPLEPVRWTAAFEALRDRSDAAPTRPVVFLAALGPFAAYTARVGFATNLFQAAGFSVVVGSGDPDEIVAAFGASGTTVACLCSSDKLYSELASSEAAALKAAGAKYLWIAGKPGKDEESDHAAGIDGYVYTGCDALEVLTTTMTVLGVN
ncbi:methylmalonyl-CoA mutase family protein [Jatrophihabitans sp.]|uniref:methylmalonyl-CoA mutase family protein n=1 Tax=Jatrophihabitans sp. TaxID=1932789 RepID=UPI0030C664BF|nr:mutA [Jatrophihabitans sp.]